ncbi:MAG TPA: tetratricopeptide repeat protein [bacterium]
MIRFSRPVLVLICIVLCSTVIFAAHRKVSKRGRRGGKITHLAPIGLLVEAQAARDSLSRKSLPLVDKVRTSLRIGQFGEYDSAFVQLERADSLTATQLRAQWLLQQYRFPDARAALSRLAKFPPSPETDWLSYRWLFLTEDLQTVDSLTAKTLAKDSLNLPALTARTELLLRLLRFEEATALAQRARSLAQTPEWRTRTTLEIAKVLYKQDRYQPAFDTLSSLLNSTTLDDEVLVNTGIVLVGLSRINEAISLFEEAVRWNSLNEMAHYYLGNGYARLDYSQLAKANGNRLCLAEGDPARQLSFALDAFGRGAPDSAQVIARRVAEEFPRVVEPWVLLGSVAWSEGRFATAENYFLEALNRLPAYGRAHNGLAKSLEGLRMSQNVHRADDSTAFAKLAMPNVPRIADFVLNWKSLSPRHQKQVALAIAPWKLYIPVLVECGSHYYIKPLHERLSDCPGLASMRDTRIDYDSRLWDDVRGCGGFTTVTGVEDVERSIFANYNTVLHELTHQVHGLFPPEDAERVRAAFRAARDAEDHGKSAFMSRYQQSSVWEYFAEGANAYYSPRRDAYDTREIVRERLLAKDTTLVSLVEYYVKGPNIRECYAVGFVNAAENAIENQRMPEALAAASKAYARSPHSENVLSELSRIYSYQGNDSLAVAYADSLVSFFPRKGDSYVEKSSALFFRHGNDTLSVDILTRALTVVDSTERNAIRQALGNALLYVGRYAEAATQYRAILAEVSDDPNALWGLGIALGDAGDFAKADSAFGQALGRRSGIIELRLDYARMLLRAGKLDEAGKQIEEAQILSPGDAQVLTMKGWYMAQREEWTLALGMLDRAAEIAPDLRLAAVLRIHVLQKMPPPRRKPPVVKHFTAGLEAALMAEAERTDKPQWLFLPRKAGYIAARIWPKFQRDLLNQYVSEIGALPALSDTAKAKEPPKSLPKKRRGRHR